MNLVRVPTRRYDDPLDAVWLATARALGLSVVRSSDVYASTDGRGRLLLGERETLDPDDCVAQMIFHELCHALVQGEDAFARADWGLDNETDRDAPREHATLRLQAFLAGRHGLRELLAPTTDYRAFWDALGADPLAPRHEPSVTLAVLGAHRAEKAPWIPHLDAALRATAAIALQARAFAGAADTTGCEADSGAPALRSLFLDAVEPAGMHPTGLPLDRAHGRTCDGCAWRIVRGTKRPVSRCRQANDARVEPSWPSCERWEPALDCLTCGACCRQAYDLVMASLDDPVITRHPDLVVLYEDRAEVKRAGDRCAALQGGPSPGAGEPFVPYTCRIYEDRPQTCRDFAMQGLHCLLARRRVGLSL